ncbi:MAG: NAD(P)H-dependent oxidoreductase [Planctomycetes bacterium]|nr:NAD(P)H-dependent oxidoreductase [Planctomycetota bacterium]
MKAAVLYYTRTNNTKKMAEMVVEGMKTVSGFDAQAFALDGVDADFVKAAKCVIVGTPVYLASMAAPVKVWLDDGAMKLGLNGKIGGAFATANFIHGGGELAVQQILSHMLVLGMFAYSGGGAHGQPVIHLGPVAIGNDLAAFNETFKTYGARMAKMTAEVFPG